VLVRTALDVARTAPGAWRRRAGRRDPRSSSSRGWSGSGWANDVSAAVRQWRHAPFTTLAAVAMLSVGVGANVAIFNLANALLLRPLAHD
jgi:hypothetical protein